MEIERIIWKSCLPEDHDCRCCGCEEKPARYVARTGNDWAVPVCEECSRKTEAELVSVVSMGGIKK
jgi:hypothetical protein